MSQDFSPSAPATHDSAGDGSTAHNATAHNATTPSIDAVEYYWRPGCPFCMNLERGLNKANIPLNKHNIWDDPAHAEMVRSIADGNETVPTVIIGDVSMVNPSAKQVKAVLAEKAPHLV